MRCAATFPQIDSLPGPERHLPADDRVLEINRGGRRSDVREHVVVAFGGGLEELVVVCIYSSAGWAVEVCKL